MAAAVNAELIYTDSDGDGDIDIWHLEDNYPLLLRHVTDGTADDLTISVTGATNSSLFLSSTGTAADAMAFSTSAGGMDLTVAGSAAGEDLDLTSASSINLTAAEAVADAIVLNASTALGGIDITSQNDIDITTTGAAGEDITITNTGGSVNITATEAAAGQFALSASGTIAGNAITATTTDGGILVTAGGGTNGDLGLTAGDDLTITTTGDTVINSADWDISATGAATNMASVGFDSGSILYQDIVEISNAEIKGLRAAPKDLIAAPGVGKFIEFVSATLVLDYGTNALTDSSDNLVIQYGSGTDVTAAITSSGFLTATADTVATAPGIAVAGTAASSIANDEVELFNTGDGEIAGNAGVDTTMTVLVTYRVHTLGL
jgi:hypothetical protein